MIAMVPVDVVALTAVILGCLMVLIPITGLTARFALKPITESLMKLNAGGADRQALQLLERRLALLEQEVHGVGELRSELQRISDDLEFQRQLTRPK
jgi:hypothetical protein